MARTVKMYAICYWALKNGKFYSMSSMHSFHRFIYEKQVVVKTFFQYNFLNEEWDKLFFFHKPC